MEQPLPHADQPMVIFKIRKSHWFLLGPVIVTAITTLFFISLVLSVVQNVTASIFVQSTIALIFLMVFGVALLVIWIDWHTTFYILTDHTIEKVSGFGTRSTTYLSLHDLSRIDCQTGLLGRVLNYGKIVVESETTEKPLVMPGVPDPNAIMNLIRQARAHVAGSDK